MINFQSLQIPPPSNWQDFESLCCDLWKAIWKDPNTIKNGRQGQQQKGVDVYGQPNQLSSWAGLQCKGKDNFTNQGLTEKEVRAEVKKAKSFRPRLSEFIIATTGPKDSRIEEVARAITDAHLRKGLFTVHILGWKDIVERIAEHPEVASKYYPTLFSNQLDQPSLKERILNNAINIYSSMGYKLLSNSTKDNYALMDSPSNQKCKLRSIEGEISKGDVILAAKEASNIKSILVAQRRVAPGARETAKLRGVQVHTIEELYKELLEADKLGQAYLTSYSNIETLYVDLSAERRTYDVAGSLAYTETYDPVDTVLDEWLDEEGKNQITILGDYGTGKTWLCLHYAAKLIGVTRRNNRSRFPIFISLRDYQPGESVQDFILRAIHSQWNVSLQYGISAIDRANQDGRLIFIFDGFDEMPHEIDGSGMVDNFNLIASIVGERSKIIVTCRRQYFRNNRELSTLLEGANEERIIDLKTRPNFEILHLREFSIPQIQKVLEKREGGNWRQTYNRILKVYDLSELARRPVLLDMILSTLPNISETATINPALLYQIYTDKWLTREERRGGVRITPELKESFTQELAWQMFNSQKFEIRFSELPAHVKSYFATTSIEISASLVKEIQQQSFLQRDEDDKFRFAHRSLMEFFVAKRMVTSVKARNYIDYRERPLSLEILSFMKDLISMEKVDLSSLIEFVTKSKDKPLVQVGYGPSNSLSLLAVCGYDLRKSDFSKTVLRNVDLQDADLSEIDFSYCDLRGAKLQRTVMRNTNFFGADMHSTVIGESKVIRSIQANENGSSLVCAGSGNFIYKLESQSGNVFTRIPHHSSVRIIASSPRHNEFATAGVDGRIRLWDWDDGLLRATMIGDEFAILSMAISHNQQWLLTGAQSGTILLWSLDDKEIVRRYLNAHVPYVRSLCFLQEDIHFVSGGADNSLKVWDISGSLLTTLEVGGLPYALECSEDGKWLFCGTNEPSIEVWAIDKWKRVKKLTQHTDTVTGLVRHPHSSEIMSIGREGQVCLWDIKSHRLKRNYHFGATIMTACFISNGDLIALGFNNGDVRAFEYSKLQAIWKFQISDGDFTCEGMDIRGVQGFAPEWIRYMKELGAITDAV
jgi:WD40 repeat protein